MKKQVINCPHCGKVLPKEFWHEEVDKVTVKCPRCGSAKNHKDAKRYTPTGVLQRYYCKDCGCRFSK
jgi:transposase-like protein